MERQAYLDTIRQHLCTAYLLDEVRCEAMIPVFLTTLREHMTRLVELAAEGDLERLSRAGHAVKGALLNIGLIDLAATAQAIEQQGKLGSRDFNYHNAITDLQTVVALLDRG